MRTWILSLTFFWSSLNACGAANDIEALQADMTFFTDTSCSQLKTERAVERPGWLQERFAQEGGGRDAGRNV